LKYRILITDTCLILIEKISDKQIKRTILNRIEGLSDEPDKQGEKLIKDLSGWGSLTLPLSISLSPPVTSTLAVDPSQK
jgi:hypothetical protein